MLFGFELLDLTNTKALFGQILSVIEKSYLINYLINSINQRDEYRLSGLSALLSFSYDLVLVNEDSALYCADLRLATTVTSQNTILDMYWTCILSSVRQATSVHTKLGHSVLSKR